MVSQPLPNPEQSDTDPLEAAADQAIATCGGDAREAVKARRQPFSRNRTGETARCCLDGICARKANAA
jgi:hypothetical protein